MRIFPPIGYIQFILIFCESVFFYLQKISQVSCKAKTIRMFCMKRIFSLIESNSTSMNRPRNMLLFFFSNLYDENIMQKCTLK